VFSNTPFVSQVIHMKFKAEMRHTNKSIHRLSSVQHQAFRPGVRLLWSVCGVGCIWGAVRAADQFLFYILLFAGIWLLLNLELPAKHQADKIIKAAGGVLPHTRYRFEETEVHISSGDYQKTISYKQFYALLEDKSYFYLFVNRNGGFMVDKSSIDPNDPAEWKNFLQNRSNLTFRRVSAAKAAIPSFGRKGRNK